jgi:hypothetical protein
MQALYWNGNELVFERSYRAPVVDKSAALIKFISPVSVPPICKFSKVTWVSKAFPVMNSSVR